MGIVMDMSSYMFEASDSDMESGDAVAQHAYQSGILACAALRQAQIQPSRTKATQPGNMPSDLATLDAELFLQRIYTYQR